MAAGGFSISLSGYPRRSGRIEWANGRAGSLLGIDDAGHVYRIAPVRDGFEVSRMSALGRSVVGVSRSLGRARWRARRDAKERPRHLATVAL